MHTETQKTTLMSMVYPPGSHANASPLHVVACNDTCSFTWTGAEHINQVKSWGVLVHLLTWYQLKDEPSSPLVDG